MGQMPPALQQTLGTLATRIREEKLLTVDLVIADRLLALGREQPVDKRLTSLHLDVRVFFLIHQHDAILVEQPLVSLVTS